METQTEPSKRQKARFQKAMGISNHTYGLEEYKPRYEQIMQELGIPVYNQEKRDKCNSILVNPEKQGLILKNLNKIQFLKSCACFLRYQDGFFNIQFLPLKNSKTANNPKFAGERA